MLFLTSTADDRVHPGHARKMAALMQSQGHDVLFYEETQGGHGGGGDLRRQAAFYATEYLFLQRELEGAEPKPLATAPQSRDAGARRHRSAGDADLPRPRRDGEIRSHGGRRDAVATGTADTQPFAAVRRWRFARIGARGSFGASPHRLSALFPLVLPIVSVALACSPCMR